MFIKLNYVPAGDAKAPESEISLNTNHIIAVFPDEHGEGFTNVVTSPGLVYLVKKPLAELHISLQGIHF